MLHTTGVNIIPENDEQRIQALRDYDLLDGNFFAAFDHIVQISASVFNVPISIISMVDADTVYSIAGVGLGDVRNGSRSTSLCALTILSDEITVFIDTMANPCLLSNPWVAGEFGLRFYAGAPVTTPEGLRIGTICLLDQCRRDFSTQDEALLKKLSKLVMNVIELRSSKQYV